MGSGNYGNPSDPNRPYDPAQTSPDPGTNPAGNPGQNAGPAYPQGDGRFNTPDPRYDPRYDPRNDPRWQQDQARAWKRAQKVQQQAWQQQQRNAARDQREYMRDQVRFQREQWRGMRSMNRASSLIGPLLLIAVAVVALMVHNGKLSLLSLLVWYGHWWPLLLIAIGAIRLLEWIVDRSIRRDGAPPRYTVGGGVIFLVVVLAVLGIAAQGGVHRDENGVTLETPFMNLNGDDWKQFMGAKHEEDAPAIDRSIAAMGTLTVDNPRGDVTVNGTSDDGRLHVTAHKEVYSNSDSSAQSRLNDLQPQIGGSDDNLNLHVQAIDGGSVDLTVLLPPSVRVVVNANHGDVHAGNLKNSTTVTANHGDVELAAIGGTVTVHVNSRNKTVTAHSINGSVEIGGTGDEIHLSDIDGAVRVNGDFFGGGNLQKIAGPIDFHTSRINFSIAHLPGEVSFDDSDELSASEAAGPFTLQTRSRDITLSRIAGDINVTNSHGKVEVVSVPPGGAITIDNHEGDVRVSLPDPGKYTVQAQTSDGDVTSSFSLGGQTQSHGMLSGTVGGGGSPIRIATTHGDVTLDRNTEAAVIPPMPPMPSLRHGIQGTDGIGREVDRTVAEANKLAQQAIRQAGDEMRNERQKQQRRQDRPKKDNSQDEDF